MGWAIAIFVILALVVVMFIGMYNKLVKMRQLTMNAWAQIDVQLKRRYDLSPNLVETVKGYMSHEKDTLERVIQARNQAISTTGVSLFNKSCFTTAAPINPVLPVSAIIITELCFKFYMTFKPGKP